MNYPYDAAPTGPISTPPNDRRQIIIVLAVVAALLLTFLGVGAVYLFSGSDKKVKASPAPELVLESVDSNSRDAFSPSVAVSNRPLDENVRTVAAQGPITPRGIQAIDGTAPGLYGGTGDASCDTAALANFLANHPGKAEAWASVFGISVDQIPYYLDTLTPVVLGRDTWVTNHSYSNGVATPFQSVLQAGTAVLVDSYGIPRVRCSCGNPLAPSASAPLSGYRTVNAPWSYYAPRQVVYVTYHNEHTTIVNNTTTVVAAPNPAPAPVSLSLIDLNTLQPLIRTVGGILNLAGLPPLQGTLPTPASLNTPFASPDPEVQSANGVQADGQPAENVLRRAAAATSAKSEASAVGADPAAPQQGSAGPSSPASPANSAALAPAPPVAGSSAPPVPTAFSGSGDIVSSLTFTAAGGTSVRCSVPDVSASTAKLNCTDGITRTVSSSYLQKNSVTSATDASGVWTVPLTVESAVEQVAVLSATWTLIPTTTVETPTTTVETPTTTVETTETTTTTKTTTQTTETATETSDPGVP